MCTQRMRPPACVNADISPTLAQKLGHFQRNLGDISKEIRELQGKSLQGNTKLRNRKHAESMLANFVDGISIPPKLATHICDAEVNDAYLDYIMTLRSKFAFMESDMAKSSAAAAEIAPELEKLRLKAVSKVRESLLSKMAMLSKPNTNFQILQQSVLLKYKYFAQFLRDHARPSIASQSGKAQHVTSVYAEVCDAYVDIISKLYAHYMRQGSRNMDKLLDSPVPASGSASNTLVEQEVSAASIAGLSSGFGKLFGAKQVVQPPTDAGFSLGERISVLAQVGSPPIVFGTALAEKRKYYLELLFRSLSHLLMDSVTSEYTFVTDFFGDSDCFAAIFKPVFDLVLESFNTTVQNCSHDLVGLLLVTRVNEEHRRIMEERRIPAMEPFFNSVQLSVWPVIKSLIAVHCDSARTCNVKLLASRSAAKDVHYVTKRFAELLAAVYSLCHKQTEPTLMTSIAPLRTEVNKLLLQLAVEYGERNKLYFLVVQYDSVVSTLVARKVRAEHKQLWEDTYNENVQVIMFLILQPLYIVTRAQCCSITRMPSCKPILDSSCLLSTTWSPRWHSAHRTSSPTQKRHARRAWLQSSCSGGRDLWRRSMPASQQVPRCVFLPRLPCVHLTLQMCAECSANAKISADVLKQALTQLLL